MDEDRSPAFDRPRGLGLRGKLGLGFGGVVALLVAVGVEGVSLLTGLGGSIDVILRENYRSVIACERMKEALERMDSGALFVLAGEPAEGRALAAEHRPRFEEALRVELGNVTLPGEGERAGRLHELFAAYTPVLDRLLAPQTPEAERRSLYFDRLYPTFREIKTTADEVLAMNQAAMAEADARARALAASSSRRMALLLLATTAFAGLLAALLLRAVLGPLRKLTAATGRIAGGDLDHLVAVTSGDELGELAASFNAMAAGLRELRGTDQARLLRARRIARVALDALPGAVAVLSPDRRVELANRSAAGLLDLDPAAEPGEPLPARDGEWLAPLLARAESHTGPEGGGEPLIRLPAAGGDRLFLPRVTVIRDREARPEQFVLELQDATDRRRGGELRAGLLANAASDLEGALVPLREILDALAATEIENRRLGEARDAAVRAQRLAAHLRASSRSEEVRQRLHLEPVDTRELVDAAVAAALPPVEQRRRRLELRLAVDPAAAPVLAERVQAERALAALLEHAAGRSPEGGTVALRVTAGDGRTRFSATDTGPILPAARIPGIFEPLEPLEGGGMTLGWAREIVQAHGGEIECESDEARGTTVWFTLPTAP